MSIVTVPKRELPEACWELLYIELIDSLIQKNANSNEESSSLDHSSVLKLEKMGFQVGQRLAERYTREKTRFQDTLEIIKFICKEFWTEIYKKPIDNLRTIKNRRGVYVLYDAKFRWLQKLSSVSSSVAKEEAVKYLIFPCGLIRGALSNLGVPCDVSAEIATLPGCNFTIKIKGA